ncbi:serine-rich adhesin for platelets-like isoform X2 [Periplaneta americana]|uniref:serine-rich adhesin for platelets-like isoform X2 n=1 Tax=Periplaneta americana TaxID=6978 RepID=UPI0037E78BA2
MQGLWSQEGPLEASEHSRYFEMISFSVDPQWCGLLFSVYCRHEKGALLGGGGFPQADAFAACSLAGPPLDADWIAIAGSVGFEICRLSSTWALIFESVKATGVILLLGVGSLVCYKICNHYWPRNRPRPRPRPSPRNSIISSQPQDSEDQLVEDLEDGDLSEVEGRYFGPNPSPREGDVPAISGSFPCSRSASGSIYPNSSTSQSDSGTSGEDEGRDADVSDGSQGEKSPKQLNIFHQKQHLRWAGESRSHNWRRSRPSSLEASMKGLTKHAVDNNSGWLIDKISKILTSTPERLQLSGSAWLNLPSSPRSAVRLTRAEARRLGSDLGLDWREELERRLASEGAETEQQQHGSTDCDSNGASCAQNLQSGTSLIRDESYDSLGFSKRLPREGSFDSTCSELSLDFSLPESSAEVDTSTMLCMEKLQQEIDQLKTNCLMMDEEFEIIKCNRNLPGMSSLMKANASSNSLGSNTVDLTPEVDALNQETLKQEKARACFAGLYSLTTIKNSTSSELSDSFPAPAIGLGGRGSIGSAESLDWDSPKLAASPAKFCIGEMLEDQSSPSKETPYKRPQVNFSSPVRSKFGRMLSEDGSPIRSRNLTQSHPSENSLMAPTPSEDELMAKLEWDEEDLTEYPEAALENEDDISIIDTDSNMLASVDTLEMDLEAELGTLVRQVSEEPDKMTSSRSFTASPNTERSSKMETSSGFESGSKMMDSCISMASDLDTNVGPREKTWTCWSSEESGCMEWDSTMTPIVGSGESEHVQQCWDEATVTAQSSSNPSELSSPGSENLPSDMLSPVSDFGSSGLSPEVENIGQRTNVFQYAVQEWQGKTKKAKTILQGYSEIPSQLGLQHLRRIRGDNYCGVRAAIFQALAQGLPVPNGAKTFQCLSHALNSEGCGWLQDWTFAGRLPYQGNNVLHGMEACLHKLDNVASLLSSTNGDREETLASLLNSDPSLDLHVMEAVKLHMLQCAMELHRENTSGSDDVPLFAILMFARDTSETPKDLMNNHLREVGNSGGLEQVEMFLLGYTLGVTLRVVRPAAYGTEDFMCSYPDWNEGNWPQVYLIAEDDRHYNVLVN